MGKREYSPEELGAMDILQLEGILTKRERSFCENYLAERNGTQAAQMAGYSQDNANAAAVTASRLLRKPKVTAYLRARAREIYHQLNISPETVAADLNRVYRRAMQAEPVMEFNRDSEQMEPTGEYVFDGRTAIKALELMGDTLGMFEKGIKHSGDTKIVLELGEAEKFAK